MSCGWSLRVLWSLIALAVLTSACTPAHTPPNVKISSSPIDEPPFDIWIRTQGDLQLIQDPRDSLLIATAEANRADVQIQWRVEGDGKDFVVLTSTKEGPISRAILSLKKPAPGAWMQDTQIEIVAGPGIQGLPEARANVRLVKFRRGGQVAPGASEICVPLRRGVPGQGWDFQPKHAYIYKNQDDSKMGRLPGSESSDSETSLLRIHYQSAEDQGEGTYRLRAQIGFRGKTGVAARYDKGSWFHNASIGLAAGILASVDNENVNLRNNSVGIRYGGYPSSVTLGAGPSNAEVGLTVPLTPKHQKQMNDMRNSEGLFVIESTGVHVPGSEIKIEKQVRIDAEVLLEQIDDDEWHLAAEASIKSYFPTEGSPVEICFSPTH